ncbi:MAG: RtcB family protein [Nitrososphaerota archaeon]|nr:RtcB family protein [Nitrososphaerota archaeon]MDG6939329.1 RtcB family protein [Nitrososphaerota archaeon]
MSIPLERVADSIWEIPKSFRPTMRVPARIFADESLMKKMQEDRTLGQAANVASLPGLLKYSIALPDAHEGYGFPIGGVAAEDAEDGVISPGGVGYDINCLHPETRVLDGYGAWQKISDVGEEWRGTLTLDMKEGALIDTRPVLFMVKEHSGTIARIRTKFGKEIVATADHPILTRRGMVPAGRLRAGDDVVVTGFEGVRYTRPADGVVLSEEAVSRALDSFGAAAGAKSRALGLLRRRGLLGIDSRSARLPPLMGLLGLAVGGGTVRAWQGRACATFRGREEDLERVRKDVRSLGFACTVRRGGAGPTGDPALVVRSTAFSSLLAALGAPVGGGGRRAPGWVADSEDWQKRIFLAAFFGAKLSGPDLAGPALGVRGEGAADFLLDIRKMLKSLGVDSEVARPRAGDGREARLAISPEAGNLRRFYGTVGYAYSGEKEALASLHALYLSCAEGDPAPATTAGTEGGSVLLLADGRALGFGEFVERSALGKGGLAYDRIEGIAIEGYGGPVFDITVGNENHNFVANGVVVSNCGVRLIRTNLTESDVRPKLQELLEELYRGVPSGVGSEGQLRVNPSELDGVGQGGAQWAVEKGYGWQGDVEHAEENGRLQWAKPEKVSQTARKRGAGQLGTLGSGNHFLEIERVNQVFDEQAAKAMGITETGQMLVLVHTGSRGFGHQVCSDYLRTMEGVMRRESLVLPDRELAAGPIKARETEDYLGAMASAANFAWANRQMITHWIRKAFSKVFRRDPEEMQMGLVYDVAHNIVKREEHDVDGVRRTVYVHRKGATRAFPPGSPFIPQEYRRHGQPVLIPGSMGTSSWVLRGGPKSLELTFGSAAHGAGRFMSRGAAKRRHEYGALVNDLRSKGILIRAASKETVVEEAPGAYKDVDGVVEVTHNLGLALKVVRMTPIGVVKG